MNVLLLGSGGYIGSTFAKELLRRSIPHQVWRANDYNSIWTDEIASLLRMIKPTLVVNCLAYIPKDSVASCDQNQEQTIRSNVMLPEMLATVCGGYRVPLAHISTGCLWSDGEEHSENDPPQRSFTGHCGFYIGTKLLGDEAVRNNCEEHYIWRVRLPFDEFDHPRNYLSKLAKFDEVWHHQNTICHRGDFVKGCLDLWEKRAAWGTYHVANPGSIEAPAIWFLMRDAGIRMNHCQFLHGPHGGSKLSVKKLLDAGVSIRPVEEAIHHSITNWRKA